MVLILKKQSAFQRWYGKKKQWHSEKRKKRYAEDPEYRQRALEASRRYRRGERTLPTLPDDAQIPFAQAAQAIGVSDSTLQTWRSKKYFPEPKHHNGHLWFSEKQVLLLKDLKDRIYGKRRWYMKWDRFKEVLASIWANWD